MLMDQRRIGFFDSGVGGLSVLREGMRELSGEDFSYLGDTLHMPYGEKSPQQIEQFTEDCISFLATTNIKAAVIACNTATCYGLDNAKKVFNFPVLGVVEPACDYAAEITKHKKIAMVATQGTVDSGVYAESLNKIDSSIEFRAVGCPDLVIAIEEGHFDDDVVKEIIKRYLSELSGFDYDTLILGCTHFPLVQSAFEEYFNQEKKNVYIVDPAYRSVLALKEILKQENLSNSTGYGQVNYYVTSNVNRFRQTVQKVMEQEEDKDIFQLVEVKKGV